MLWKVLQIIFTLTALSKHSIKKQWRIIHKNSEFNFLHGGQLNGNNSKKLLDKADDLMNVEIDNDLMLPYVNALKATKVL